MMKLSATDGLHAVSELISSTIDSLLTYAAEVFSKIADDYKKSPTPYRVALVKANGGKTFLGFSKRECSEAIEHEFAATSAQVGLQKAQQMQKSIVKRAVWRLANLAESRYVFDLFKKDPSKSLKHIREQFAAEYRRTAKYALERYGFHLTIQDYSTNIWIHLSAGQTWKAFDSYRGDSSVYSWLKSVCQHCIVDYIESCGYTPLYVHNDYDCNDDCDDLAQTVGNSSKLILRIDDYEGIQIADTRGTYDLDYVTDNPNFLIDRINEMPWEKWKKDFIIDSIINEESVASLTEKYGTMVAFMQGRNKPYDRTWTDNRNSRLRRDLYAYALAYLHNDKKVLAEYAKRQRDFERHISKAPERKTA